MFSLNLSLVLSILELSSTFPLPVMVQTPIEKATVRQARDDDRPTEDDIAKAKLGPQGVPGKPDKPPIADEDELQLPKALDPGHTA
jgi:hypothetical protein